MSTSKNRYNGLRPIFQRSKFMLRVPLNPENHPVGLNFKVKIV